jgi:hypothetical protein
VARDVRIVCTISPRRGVLSHWRERDRPAQGEPARPAEATSSNDGSSCPITDLAAVKRAKGLATA